MLFSFFKYYFKVSFNESIDSGRGTITIASQRSTQIKPAFSRETNLGTLQSGQEEDFSKTTNSLNINSLASVMVNSNQKLNCTSSSSVNSTINNQISIESKDLYYNRYIKQNSPSPPIKLSSFSPTKLKPSQVQSLNTPGTSTTSSASLPSNSFQVTSNWNPNSYSSHNNQMMDSSDNSNDKISDLYKNQQQHNSKAIANKNSKNGSTSIIENTPPQSPAGFVSMLHLIDNETTKTDKHKNSNNSCTKFLDDSNDNIQTIHEFVSPLNAARLRPLRQQTRNAVVIFKILKRILIILN